MEFQVCYAFSQPLTPSYRCVGPFRKLLALDHSWPQNKQSMRLIQAGGPKIYSSVGDILGWEAAQWSGSIRLAVCSSAFWSAFQFEFIFVIFPDVHVQCYRKEVELTNVKTNVCWKYDFKSCVFFTLPLKVSYDRMVHRRIMKPWPRQWWRVLNAWRKSISTKALLSAPFPRYNDLSCILFFALFPQVESHIAACLRGKRKSTSSKE